MASHLQNGNIIIFESTVYPGAMKEECAPLLSEISGLGFNTDFHVGYSPERINPGDSDYSLSTIVKVTPGSTSEAAQVVDELCKSIIRDGTYLTSSIKVAEAAKVIENTQRDLNNTLANELAILFDKLGIDTREMLQAVGREWSFLPFTPGLIGGDCIGVAPYYLACKAQQVGYHPDIILTGRRINDDMGFYVAERVVKLMLSKRIHTIDSRILIMELAFKENCSDSRNNRVVDIIDTLQSFHSHIAVYDPWIDKDEPVLLISELEENCYDAVIVAVAHDRFKELGIDGIRKLIKDKSAIFDVKHTFNSKEVDGSL